MSDHFDVAIVGAGAAGLAAAARLADAPVTAVVLEARDRIGGRAWTRTAGGWPLDAGCEWLHSAQRNTLVAPIAAAGFTIDRTPAHWQRRSGRIGMSGAETAAYGQAFAALDARLEAAAAMGVEGPASDYLQPGDRWNGLLDAASSWYNGAEWSAVSIQDYAAYEDGGDNWRVREGYGAAIAALARPETPIRLSCAVESIDHGRRPIRLRTSRGTLTAEAVIVTAPTPILAGERLRFSPGLPGKIEAAAALPLGLADKAFIGLAQPEMVPVEGHGFGDATSARTASLHLRPFGRPYVEAYFGGALARALEAEGPGALVAFAIDQLVNLMGSAIRPTLSGLIETGWAGDPWALGAYSHARPLGAGARAKLAEPVEGRLFFAGEATHPHFFSTAHGAWESGVRAAEEALAALAES